MYIDLGADRLGGPAGMMVDPDKLLQVKQGFEDEADRIRLWLETNQDRLRHIEPPGNDPCSRDTMDRMGQVGHTAVLKTEAYVRELIQVARKLHETARAYGLIEDDNTAKFRQEPE